MSKGTTGQPYVVEWADETRAAAVGSERQMLEAFLDFHRETLLEKCADLSPERLATRSVAPSRCHCWGLVRHMAGVERWWFRQHMCRMRPDAQPRKQNPDLDFDGTDPARWPDDLGTYHAGVVAARRLWRTCRWISWPPTGMATASACVGCICT